MVCVYGAPTRTLSVCACVCLCRVLMQLLLANFMIDLDWMVSECPVMRKMQRITILTGEGRSMAENTRQAHTHTQTDRHTHTDTHTHTQTDRHTHTDTDTDADTHDSLPDVTSVCVDVGGALDQSAGRLRKTGPRVEVYRPPLPIAFGSFHAKMILLTFNDRIRVCIHTANFIYPDW